MGKSQSKELDDIILNIYRLLENSDSENFNVDEVIKNLKLLSKFKGKSMKCIYLDEKYLNQKLLDGFLKLFYNSVRYEVNQDLKAKELFDLTYPDIEIRKKACFIYFLESVEYVFEGVHDFDCISINNLYFKNKKSFIGEKVKGKCYDFYNKHGVKNIDIQ